MTADRRGLERDPVDANGQPVAQWGGDVVAKLSPAEIVDAQGKGHLNRYLMGEDVETQQPPQRPEQCTAEQVAQMSSEERVAALTAGRLADYMARPAGRSAGGAEL